MSLLKCNPRPIVKRSLFSVTTRGRRYRVLLVFEIAIWKLKLAKLEADAPIQNNSKFDSIGSRAGAASFSANNLKKTTPRLGIRFRCISEWPAAAHLLDPVRFWQKFGRRMIQEPPLGWTCSNLVKFISRAGNGNCLLDRPDNTMVRENPRRLPGEDYSVNKQCELVFGKGSEVCAHMVGDGKSHIFLRIHAVVTKCHYSIYISIRFKYIQFRVI